MFAMLAVLAAAQSVPVAAPSSPFQLSGAQVRQCGTIAADRAAHVAELARRDDVLQAEQATLTARQAELTATAAKVNTKKAKDVAAYNAMSADFNAQVPLLHEKVVARNAYAAEIPVLVDTYNQICAHKSMNPQDVAALPEDQRTVVSAGATTSTIMVPAPKAPPRSRKRK